jgi:hypothetical protein
MTDSAWLHLVVGLVRELKIPTIASSASSSNSSSLLEEPSLSSFDPLHSFWLAKARSHPHPWLEARRSSSLVSIIFTPMVVQTEMMGILWVVCNEAARLVGRCFTARMLPLPRRYFKI